MPPSMVDRNGVGRRGGTAIRPQKLRLVGVEIPAQQNLHARMAQAQRAFRRASAEDPAQCQAKQLPPLGCLAICEDQDGHRCALLSAAGGALQIPVSTGSPVAPLADDLSGGGFLSIEDIRQALGGNLDTGWSPAVRQQVAEAYQAAGIPVAPPAGAAVSKPAAGAGGPSRSKPSEPSIADRLRDLMKGEFQSLVEAALTDVLQDFLQARSPFGPDDSTTGKLLDAIADGDLGKIRDGLEDLASEVFSVANVAGMMANLGMGLLVDRVFGSLWKSDDKASLASQLLRKYAAAMVKDFAAKLVQALQDWLLGTPVVPGICSVEQSAAWLRVAQLGDVTSAEGVVINSAKTVFVDGVLAARKSDFATMSKPDFDTGPIVEGVENVLIEGLPAAGVGFLAVGAMKGISAEIGITRMVSVPNATYMDTVTSAGKKPHVTILWGLIDLGPAGGSEGCGGGDNIWWIPDRILVWDLRFPCDNHDLFSYAWGDDGILDNSPLDVLLWQLDFFAVIYSSGAGPFIAVPYSVAVAVAAFGQYGVSFFSQLRRRRLSAFRDCLETSRAAHASAIARYEP